MEKILVRIYMPLLEQNFDVWIPVNKKVISIIVLLFKNYYDVEKDSIPSLYNRYSGEKYNFDAKIKETNITNSTELILI